LGSRVIVENAGQNIAEIAREVWYPLRILGLFDDLLVAVPRVAPLFPTVLVASELEEKVGSVVARVRVLAVALNGLVEGKKRFIGVAALRESVGAIKIWPKGIGLRVNRLLGALHRFIESFQILQQISPIRESLSASFAPLKELVRFPVLLHRLVRPSLVFQ